LKIERFFSLENRKYFTRNMSVILKFFALEKKEYKQLSR